MKIFESPRNRIIIILVAFALFVTYKYNDIFLPYFWDELAGYMCGVLHMLDHGISILPSAIPAELSFGHPLLLHFIMASVASVFGSSVAVMHSTTLVFTFFLALGTYLLAHSLSKSYAIAVFSFILCLAQPVVIAQSTQVLLEVFLALCFVYAAYFYTRGNYALSVLFCTFGVLTKETGIVMAIAFIVHHLLEFLLTGNGRKWARLSAFYSIPFIVFGAFLLIQKQTYGWYLNPINFGKTDMNLGSIKQKMWDYPMEFTFINQGRFALSIVLFGALIYFLLKGVRSAKWSYDRNIMLVAIFCFGFIVFSSIADAMDRYLLALIPFAMILFSSAIWYLRRLHALLPVFLLAACVIVNFLFIDNGKRYTDVDISYRHLVKTSQMVIDYVNSGEFEGDTVKFEFPLTHAASDPRYGYFKTRRFVAESGSSDMTKYFIYITPGNLDANPPDTLRLQPVREFSSGFSRALVYKRVSF